MDIQNVEVFNFEGALRGMRNPKNSWDKSDSDYNSNIVWNDENKNIYDYDRVRTYDYCIGPNDMKLATNLIKAGNEHRKFLRQIFVSMDITAPLYIWKEMDTYKIGTTTNSTSTMHKITANPITLDCFETHDYDAGLYLNKDRELMLDDAVTPFIDILEKLRQLYIETGDKRYWKELIRWLPESWLQTRTWTANYEVLRSIYHQRKNHKLLEWQSFCDFIRINLPYAEEFIVDKED